MSLLHTIWLAMWYAWCMVAHVGYHQTRKSHSGLRCLKCKQLWLRK